MADKTLTIDVVDLTAPPFSHINIAVINQPNPVTGYSITGPDLLHLIQFSKYKITDSSTGKPVNGKNIYEYFPELDPSGGGGGGGGGGDIELMSQSEWNALSTEEKQTYELLAIQDSDTGFDRGELVYGKDYNEKSWNFEIIHTGSTSSTASYTFQDDGKYQLFMIAINSEASTFGLNNAASLNGNAITGEDLKYNNWNGSASDKRNYRLTKFEFNASAGDTLSFNTSNVSGYTITIYAIIKSDIASLVKSLSTPDATTSGSFNEEAIVMYGTSNSNSDGSINIESYSPNTLITTPSPGSGYRSSYIFWFVIPAEPEDIDKGKILDLTYPELTVACHGSNSNLAGPVTIVNIEGV